MAVIVVNAAGLLALLNSRRSWREAGRSRKQEDLEAAESRDVEARTLLIDIERSGALAEQMKET